jgi:hypothetical protein
MGRNVVQRLQDGGIAAKKATLVTVPAGDIFAPPKGHPLYHPRFGDPVDPDMRDDILRRGVEKPLLVRDEGEHGGRRVLLLVDGGRRLRNTLAAQEQSGQTIYVPVEIFSGDDGDAEDGGGDAAVLRERLRRNADPLKRPDAPGILALTIRQYTALRPGADAREVARELAPVMPRGVGPAEVEALMRWQLLTADARKRFEGGAPIGLLAAVLDAPRAEQVATLDKLIAAGVKTAKGATRRARAERDARDPWARRMSPRRMVEVANAARRHDAVGAAVAAGLLLAACKTRTEADEVLKGLPMSVADTIREARATKPAKGIAR